MSNVKRIEIEYTWHRDEYLELLGLYPEQDNAKYLLWLKLKARIGELSLNPYLGIKFQLDDLASQIRLRFSGDEALGVKYLELLVYILKELGGNCRAARYWDIEEGYGPIVLKPFNHGGE